MTLQTLQDFDLFLSRLTNNLSTCKYWIENQVSRTFFNRMIPTQKFWCTMFCALQKDVWCTFGDVSWTIQTCNKLFQLRVSDLQHQLELIFYLEPDPQDAGTRSGLLISMLKNMNLFHLTGLITLVLLM